MKKIILSICILLLAATGFSQTPYYWVGGASGAFSTPANWNTALDGSGSSLGAAPAATDILIFDGSNIGGAVPATGTVTPSITTSYPLLQLKFQNAADVVFYRFSSGVPVATGTSTFTIGGDGTAADDFTIDATSSLKLTSISYPFAQSFVVAISATATATISGTLRIQDGGFAKNYISAAVANSIFFASGSNCYVNNTFAASYPLSASGGATINNGIVFQSGSSLIFQGGNSPYTTTSAAIPMVFNTGSNYIFEAAIVGTNTFRQHNLPNIIIRNGATVNEDGAPFNMDNLTINAGATFNLLTNGGHPVAGNIVNNGTFGSIAGATTSHLIMVGITPQTISGSGVFNAVSAFSVATDADVTLNANLIIGSASGPPTSNITGKLNVQGFTVSSTGTTVPGPISFKSATTVTTSSVVTLTTGSNTVTLTAGTYPTANVGIGNLVTGTGIPANSYVIATSSGTNSFTMSKAATSTFAGTGTVTISNTGGTLATSNAGGIDGSITTTGARSFNSTSNYIFNAATTAPFSISGGSTIGNLTLNASVTTNKSINVGGSLNLASGFLTIRNTDTVRLTTGTDIAGFPFSTSKYIKCDISGSNVGVLRMDNISSAKLFPVGNATNYLPVTLTPVSAMDFAVSVFQGATVDGTPTAAALTAGEKDRMVDAVWTINRVTGTGDCAVQTNWPAGLEGTAFSSFINPQIGIGRYNGSTWDPYTGSGDNGLNTATSTFSSFSPFVVGEFGTILPVYIKSIAAAIKPTGTLITWEVENEISILRYEIERSSNGSNFATVGSVSAGNRAVYNFTDAVQLNGTVYYRIKVIGLNGYTKYSTVIKVKLNAAREITVYPNPVTKYLVVSGMENRSTIKVVNSFGQIVMQQNSIAGTQSLDVSLLKAGIYSLVVVDEAGKLITKSFIKE